MISILAFRTQQGKNSHFRDLKFLKIASKWILRTLEGRSIIKWSTYCLFEIFSKSYQVFFFEISSTIAWTGCPLTSTELVCEYKVLMWGRFESAVRRYMERRSEWKCSGHSGIWISNSEFCWFNRKLMIWIKLFDRCTIFIWLLNSSESLSYSIRWLGMCSCSSHHSTDHQ